MTIFNTIVSIMERMIDVMQGIKRVAFSLDLNIPGQLSQWDPGPSGKKQTPADQDHDDPADYQYTSEIFHFPVPG
jgi:hypothetical protein